MSRTRDDWHIKGLDILESAVIVRIVFRVCVSQMWSAHQGAARPSSVTGLPCERSLDCTCPGHLSVQSTMSHSPLLDLAICSFFSRPWNGWAWAVYLQGNPGGHEDLWERSGAVLLPNG